MLTGDHATNAAQNVPRELQKMWHKGTCGACQKKQKLALESQLRQKNATIKQHELWRMTNANVISKTYLFNAASRGGDGKFAMVTALTRAVTLFDFPKIGKSDFF